ncbi:hypothetical protein [Enterococcus diestrammenae]|uniref:Uncharacterized protein n=1 Tax=Enterococcus diestrammenae TaxID=1155073 RepID=A0ABV0F3R6_9ENTE|nr:hypothetical protein [Enterococcus diestrammenae]KAF1298515.1 hypothetical protein BAU18_01285 [Enterococcus diestrammenae]
MLNLETPVGNFWLESEGVRIPFEAEDQVAYFASLTFSNFKSEIDFAVHIKVNPEEIGKVNELWLRSDLDEKQWEYESWNTGETLCGNNFLNRQKNCSLSIGQWTHDAHDKNNDEYYHGITSRVQDPQFCTEWELHHEGDHVKIELGYTDLEPQATQYTSFAIAVKYYENPNDLDTEVSDLAVFFIL